MKNLAFCLVLCLAFLACKKEDAPPDLCAGITCLNGGTCANGACNCPEQFTGSDCSQQKTPSKIEVTQITVTDFPAVNGSGGSWDFTDGPDIYPVITFNNTEILNLRDFFREDATPGNYSWTSISQNVNLTNPTQQYEIELWDKDDFGPDQFLGGLVFTPYSSTNGFPSELILEGCSGCVVGFRIQVEYHF